MTRETTAERLVRVETELKNVTSALNTLAAQGTEAAASRRRVYEVQEKTAQEIIHIHHRLDNVEKSVEAIRPTTAELERVRDRVIFAGSLGKAMWGIGKALLAAAAGAMAYWYAMTGRTPP